ncbi:hypothetical protein NQZ79_g3374 [Umbelopsis isabellina]|nr:hypothetical protein NQZ79_g3374 [Umbelopsis isabellina]
MMYSFGIKRRPQKVGCQTTTKKYAQPLSVQVHDGKTPKLHVEIKAKDDSNSISPLIDSGYPTTAVSANFPKQLPTIQEDGNLTVADAIPRITEAPTSVMSKEKVPVVMEVLTEGFQPNVKKLIDPAYEETDGATAHVRVPERTSSRKPMKKSITAPNLWRLSKAVPLEEESKKHNVDAVTKVSGNRKAGSAIKDKVMNWFFGNKSNKTMSKTDKSVPERLSRKLQQNQMPQLQIVEDKYPHTDENMQVLADTKIECIQPEFEADTKRHTLPLRLERRTSLVDRTRQAVNLVKTRSLRRTRSCVSGVGHYARNQVDILPGVKEHDIDATIDSTDVAKTLTRANTVTGVRQYAITRQPLKHHLMTSESLKLPPTNYNESNNFSTTQAKSPSSPAMSLSDIQSPQKTQTKVMRKPVSIREDLYLRDSKSVIGSTRSSMMRTSQSLQPGQYLSEMDFIAREEVFSFPDVDFSDDDSMDETDFLPEPEMQVVPSSKTESQITSMEAPPYINISATEGVASVMGAVSSKPSVKSLVKSNSTSSLLTVDSTISKGNVDLTVKCVADVIYETICKNHASLRFSSDAVLLYREASHQEPYSHVPYTQWRQVHEQLAYVFECGELRAECAIITLIYIERMLKNTRIDLYDGNWRLTVLGALLLAVKVWDDCAVYNIDFISLFPEIGVRYIYDVSIKSSLFANEYFKLRGRAMSQKFQERNKRGVREQTTRSYTSNNLKDMTQEEFQKIDSPMTMRFDSTTKPLSAKQADKLDACSDRCGWRQSETMHDLSKLASTVTEPTELLISSTTMGPFGGVGGNIFNNIDDVRKCNSDLAFVTLGKAIIN